MLQIVHFHSRLGVQPSISRELGFSCDIIPLLPTESDVRISKQVSWYLNAIHIDSTYGTVFTEIKNTSQYFMHSF